MANVGRAGDRYMRNIIIPVLFITATFLAGCYSPSASHTQTTAPTLETAQFHPMFITEPGTTNVSSDGLWRVVVSAAGDSVDLSYHEMPRAAGAPSAVWSTTRVPGPAANSAGWKAHDGWFVFIENTSRAWVYDGDNYLCLVVNTPGHSSFYPAPAGFPCAVPAGVYSRLPASVQKGILKHG